MIDHHPDVTPEVYAGLLGRTVDIFCPHTEAHPIAVASQVLVAYANAVGRGPHQYIGETRHGTNEFMLLIGQTAKGRKGDSLNVALRPLAAADGEWGKSCLTSGMSSGEGVLDAIRDDTVVAGKKKGEEIVQPGVRDKRLMIVEPEFSKVLKNIRRQTNTLSNVLREAFDSPRYLKTMTRNSKLCATEPHISVIGHSTQEDMEKYLDDVEVGNGLANRFMYVLTKRVQLLPDPGRAEQRDVDHLVEEFRKSLFEARKRSTLHLSAEAREMWIAIYPEVSRDDVPGLLGNLLARSEAHVRRLAAIYSLLDSSPEIEANHLESALSLWRYCEASTRLLFGQKTGNSVADKILRHLKPEMSMTRNEIVEDIFSKHVTKASLDEALDLLVKLGRITIESEPTAGRRREVIRRGQEPS